MKVCFHEQYVFLCHKFMSRVKRRWKLGRLSYKESTNSPSSHAYVIDTAVLLQPRHQQFTRYLFPLLQQRFL